MFLRCKVISKHLLQRHYSLSGFAENNDYYKNNCQFLHTQKHHANGMYCRQTKLLVEIVVQ
jgi:hypothetical protein